MRILIADDHPIVRLGVRELLIRKVPDADVGEAESGRQALAMIRAEPWDVVVLDVSMPGKDDLGLNGYEVLHQLTQIDDAPPVLMLSMHTTEEHVIRALQSGASGYVTKESAPTQLAAAVTKIQAGGVYIEPELAERVAFDLTRPTDQPLHRRLSDREYDVLTRLASGQTPTAIAEALHLSVKTVSTYRKRILEKTGLKNTAQLMRYALENSLVR